MIVKDSEKTLRTKYPIYESFHVDSEDPIIKKCIEETLLNFGAEPDSIQVKIHMEIK